MQILKFKTQLMIAFFTDIDHDYDNNQWTSKKRNLPNGSKSTNHNSWTRPFEPVEVTLRVKMSAKLTDDSKKHNH